MRDNVEGSIEVIVLTLGGSGPQLCVVLLQHRSQPGCESREGRRLDWPKVERCWEAVAER